jgi:hypothetical protein
MTLFSSSHTWLYNRIRFFFFLFRVFHDMIDWNVSNVSGDYHQIRDIHVCIYQHEGGIKYLSVCMYGLFRKSNWYMLIMTLTCIYSSRNYPQSFWSISNILQCKLLDFIKQNLYALFRSMVFIWNHNWLILWTMKWEKEKYVEIFISSDGFCS